MSVDRKVSPGYSFAAAPECKYGISAPPHLPVTPCKNTIFAFLRKLFDLLNVIDVSRIFPSPGGRGQQGTVIKALFHPPLPLPQGGEPYVNDIVNTIVNAVSLSRKSPTPGGRGQGIMLLP
jgi:hypothetical protein